MEKILSSLCPVESDKLEALLPSGLPDCPNVRVSVERGSEEIELKQSSTKISSKNPLDGRHIPVNQLSLLSQQLISFFSESSTHTCFQQSIVKDSIANDSTNTIGNGLIPSESIAKQPGNTIPIKSIKEKESTGKKNMTESMPIEREVKNYALSSDSLPEKMDAADEYLPPDVTPTSRKRSRSTASSLSKTKRRKSFAPPAAIASVQTVSTSLSAVFLRTL